MARLLKTGAKTFIHRLPVAGAGVAFVFVIAALLGCAGSIDHNTDRARARAEEFARIAFVDRDFERSYKLLADGTRRYVSVDKFREAITRLHPKGYPSTVTARESEPMPGEKAIYVFLSGQNGGEHFYYRLTMEGMAETEYRVLQFDRPSNPRR